MLENNRSWWPLGIAIVLATLYCWVSQNFTFFWDTVQLGAKHGLWFYDQNLSTIFLPEEIDSGHPTLFGLYLAGVWKLVGTTSLVASHWAMWPFVVLIFYSLYRIGEYCTNALFAYWFMALGLVEPILSSQLVLVSPDVVVMAMFLWAVTAILNKRAIVLLIATSILVLVSMRGMMIVVALYLFALFSQYIENPRAFSWRDIIAKALPFVPSGLLTIAFLWLHYTHTGWIGYHADSPWAPSFEKVGGLGILKNIAIFGWRSLDYGRVFVLVVFLYLGYKNFSALILQKKVQQLSGVVIFLLLLLSPSFLLHESLGAHRYILPFLLMFNMLTLVVVYQVAFPRRHRRFLAIILLGLATGNLWLYPPKISQGWDSTLGHLTYYELRTKMIAQLDDDGINLNEIGTVFPEIGPLRQRDLSDRQDGFERKDFARQTYIYYSNIMNDFSDEEIDILNNDWQIKYAFSKGLVEVILYEKK